MIAPNTFSDVLDATRHEEQRLALRGLLMNPILFAGSDVGGQHASGGGSRSGKAIDESFVLVRRHQAYLTHWFARYTGWTLILRSGSARLVKRTIDTGDATRGAHDPGSTGAPLSRQSYVLWCLSLAELHDEGRQTTLQRLAEQVVRMAESNPELAEAGCQFDLKTAATRRAIVCIVRLLLKYGVLRRVEGDETKFAESVSIDCLYDIDRGLLTDVLYLPASLGQSRSSANQDEDFEAKLAAFHTVADEDALRPRDVEHRLIGRLLDNPVLYFDELTQREYLYWQSQRARLLTVIEDATGLIAEVRAEGVALLDPFGELTDAKMPDSGTVGHATLLLAEFLARDRSVGGSESAPEGVAQATCVPIETLRARLAELAKQHESHWRKGVCEPAQTALLLEDALDRLEMLRMIRRLRSAIVPLPAIHRFSVDEMKGDG
jgi:uncharacterized protein (TIGR02678 family)